MLTDQHMQIIQSSIPVLETRGEEIVSNFYALLFKNNPELKNIFNQTNQKTGFQIKALTNTIYYLSKNLPNIKKNAHLEQIAHKHASLGIQASHYPLVGQSLLESLRLTLGQEIADDTFLQAWAKAYQMMADFFIDLEADLIKKSNQIGFFKVKITNKKQETQDIMSFYLEVPPHQQPPIPGQYISLKIHSENLDHIRQYSVCKIEKNGEWKIGVKKENQGIVSNFLHHNSQIGDEIMISAPFGNFQYQAQDQRKRCFIAQGIGITPILPILDFLEKEKKSSLLLYASKSAPDQAYLEELKTLNYTTTFSVYADQNAIINKDFLTKVIDNFKDYSFYICGNMNFSKAMMDILKEEGVENGQIYCEAFGPQQALSSL